MTSMRRLAGNIDSDVDFKSNNVDRVTVKIKLWDQRIIEHFLTNRNLEFSFNINAI